MLWVIVILILIVGGIFIGAQEDVLAAIFYGFLGFALGLAITAISVVIIIANIEDNLNCSEKYDCKVIYEEYSICALIDNSNTEISAKGGFFLGCGTYVAEGKSDLYYHYFVKTDEGILYKSIKASNAYVNEIEKGTPRIVIHTKNIYFPKSNFMRDWLAIDKLEVDVGKSVIYIPKGTIKYDYNIDMG